jgi:hypothetical protein
MKKLVLFVLFYGFSCLSSATQNGPLEPNELKLYSSVCSDHANPELCKKLLLN